MVTVIGNCCMLSDLKEVPTIDLGNNNTLRLEIEEPSSELLEKARKELRETPELAAQSIAELKELLKGKVAI